MSWIALTRTHISGCLEGTLAHLIFLFKLITEPQCHISVSHCLLSAFTSGSIFTPIVFNVMNCFTGSNVMWWLPKIAHGIVPMDDSWRAMFRCTDKNVEFHLFSVFYFILFYFPATQPPTTAPPPTTVSTTTRRTTTTTPPVRVIESTVPLLGQTNGPTVHLIDKGKL